MGSGEKPDTEVFYRERHMKVLLNAIVAILFLALPQEAEGQGAGVGMPMMYALTEGKEAIELASLVEASLKEDASGNALIKGSPCATPLDFFNGIKELHPESNLSSIDQLPMYLKGLKRVKARDAGFTNDRYYMSRMLCKKDGTTDGSSLDLSGTWGDKIGGRAFTVDEYVWVDVNTGKPVLAGDCSNIVGEKIPEKVIPPSVKAETCSVVRFKVPVGVKVRFGAMAESEGPPSDCWSLKQGTEERTYPPSPCDECDWMAPLVAIAQDSNDGVYRRPVHTGLYTARAIEQELSFPHWIEARYLVICIDEEGGRGQSDGWAVAPRTGEYWVEHVHIVPADKWPVWGSFVEKP